MTTMNLLSSDLRQRPAWTEVVTQLLHQPGGRWQETELDHNHITLMVPSGNSYRVLRLLVYSAVDVGKPRTIQWIGGLYDFCRSDRSDAPEAKIVYALETDEEGEEGKGEGMEGYMKLQINLLSTRNPPLSSIPILPISLPSDLPSLLTSLQQPSLAPAPAHIPIPPAAHAQHLPNSYHHTRATDFDTYIPSRDTLLPLCTVPSASHNRPHSHPRFTPLSPQSVAILSGPIFINFPGLKDLLELVETAEGKEQIRNAMALASGSEQVEVEAERFLTFWEQEFAV